MVLFQIEKQNLIEIIQEYLYKNKNSLSNDNKNIFLITKIKNDEIKIGLGFGNFNFTFANTNIKISYLQEGTPKGLDVYVDYYKRFTLECEDEEKLKLFINTCYESEKKTDKNITGIFVCNEYGEWYMYNKIPSRTLRTIYLDKGIKDKIVNDINNFLISEKEYNDFGIPYKRTYLLTGIPGSGKTSLVKSLCNHFNYNLSILSVSKKFDNSSLMHAIKELEEKTILLLEDIDSLFEKRQSTTDNPSLTFSNLINILDGVLYRHATIIFLTTNHPEKLDHALLRIGRIDLVINFDYPNKAIIEKLFNDVFKDKYENDDLKNQFNKFIAYINSEKLTMSSIINFLFRYKIDWENNISELINTNNFICKILKNNNESLYT